jgi:hypothetical protein
MNTFYPYIFGFENGLPPEIAKQKREDEAFELFMTKILKEDEYNKRNQARLIKGVVSSVMDEILWKYL